MESKLYDIEKLKYPIGKFIKPTVIDKIIIESWINDIENLPAQIKATLAKLSIAELQKPYRPDGWTKIQVLNHIADSHMNALIRIKLALTENSPTIKPYNQNSWANLEDGKNTPIEISLAIIEGVHYRLALLLRSLVDFDFEKVFIHPEYKTEYKVKESIGIYAWHGKHHLKHIEQVW